MTTSIEDVSVESEFGVVQLNKGRRARPATTESTTTDGASVNITTEAVAPIPAHYQVSFYMTASHKVSGIKVVNGITLRTVVAGPGRDAEHLAIEDAAARQLPDLLRGIADELQRIALAEEELRNRSDEQP